jgi:hypothetical protein
MKIQLILDLDLPETCAELGLEELTELLHDVQVNHAIVAHRWMAVKDLVRHQKTKKEIDKIAADFHNYWADVLQTGTFTVRTV